jgi:hypothetical protein
VSRVVSSSTKRPYGILRVTRIWGTSRATMYRHRGHDEPRPRRRPGPVGPLPDAALVEAIRKLLAESPFHGEGYRKGLGSAPLRRHPDVQAARPAADPRAWAASAATCRPSTRPQGS